MHGFITWLNIIFAKRRGDTEVTDLAQLKKAKETLIACLMLKAEQHDWRGVADIANDLREVELQIYHVKGQTPARFGGLSPAPRETDCRMERL